VQAHPPLSRILVGVDPAGSSTSGTVGIVAVGLSAQRWPHPITGRPVRHGYVLADASLGGPPEVWARATIDLAHDLQADEIVAEVNYGGEMVESTIRAVDSTVPVRVVHASRGKKIRAEPVAAVASQGLLHHVGDLPLLEEEQTTWVEEQATWSPNRLDALVWAVTPALDQMGGRGEASVSVPTGSQSSVQSGRTAQTRRSIER
jgi:phage terminase large subunit-like protein